MNTALNELISMKVGEPLGDWISDRRSAGQTWADLAISLRMEHDVRVTGETLRRWYGSDDDKAVAA